MFDFFIISTIDKIKTFNKKKIPRNKIHNNLYLHWMIKIKGIKEAEMKRTFLTAVILMLFGFCICGESVEKPRYGNIFLSVWRLDADYGNITTAIIAPIEKTIKESWLFESIILELDKPNSSEKIITKESFKFHFSVKSDGILVITISENNRNILSFKHYRPSSAEYILYGSDFAPYLINVTFTLNDHQIGIIGPGIRKVSDNEG